MSTPTEGPLFTPGSYFESAEYLRNLTAEQQESMRQFVDMTAQQRQTIQQFMDLTPEAADKLIRSANKKPLRARAEATIARSVARVKDVYHHQTERLSDAAQSLASQAREYRQAVVGGASLAAAGVAQAYRDVRDPVVERYNQASEQVADLVDRGAVAVDAAAQWASDRADAVGQAVAAGTAQASRTLGRGAEAVGRGAQAAADGAVAAGGAVVNGVAAGARATGRGAAAVGGAVVGAGQGAVAAGQRLAGTVSRWAQDRWTNAQLRAEQSMAAINAFRFDPNQPQGVFNTREKLELSAHFSQMLNARDPEAFANASQVLNEKMQSAAQAQNMSAALGGMAQPGSAAPAQTTGQAEGNQQGAQTKVDLTKNNTKGGPGLGG